MNSGLTNKWERTHLIHANKRLSFTQIVSLKRLEIH